MNLSLSPEIEQHIHEQVRSGRFRSPEEVVEAAIAHLDESAYDDTLTDEDIAAIEESDVQSDCGEVISLEALRAEYERKYTALEGH